MLKKKLWVTGLSINFLKLNISLFLHRGEMSKVVTWSSLHITWNCRNAFIYQHLYKYHKFLQLDYREINKTAMLKYVRFVKKHPHSETVTFWNLCFRRRFVFAFLETCKTFFQDDWKIVYADITSTQYIPWSLEQTNVT